jgi:parallel beta-helix repeat protein
MKNAIITIFLMLGALSTSARGAEMIVPSQYPTIQSAIDAAVNGDTVIVAPGTYTGPGNRDIDFLGKAIAVRSIDPNDPNIVAATIIDCNGTEAEPHQGFYFHNCEGSNSVLDGFTITNGYVMAFPPGGTDAGGGIACSGSSPTINNCRITDNYAHGYGGGGIYCYESNPTITNCNISGNLSGGGGILCRDSSPIITNCAITDNTDTGVCCSNSSPTIANCTITNNSSSRGSGGIYCYHGSPVIANCDITDNAAGIGGGIYCDESSPTITDCNITGNSAREGGGICCEASNPTITNCTIIGNSAYDDGGGIYCYESSTTITSCIITGNSANRHGGGIGCDGDLTIINSTISGNSAEGRYTAGGGIYCGGDLTIINSIISGNSAGNGGGAYCDGDLTITNSTVKNNSGRVAGGIFCGDSTITNCTITGNTADGDDGGGGIYCVGDSTIITNCTISDNSVTQHRNGGGVRRRGRGGSFTISYCTITGNSAGGYGGGLYGCDGLISNCTITGNSAGGDGGGIFCDGGDGPVITNCTITGNSARRSGALFAGGGPITNCIIWNNWPDQLRTRSITITYSNVQGGYPGLGNIDADPCFVEPGYWADANDPNIIVEPNDPNAVWLDGDYYLLPDSPCINTGDPNYVPEPNETDLDGLPRVIGARIDMGAYEFNHQPVAVAGPNQTVYAWIDGLADVNLDGSASYDDDNDVLDYYWSWTIDGNSCEANDVNPTIQLPVGKHTIELVLDDGIDLSQPDYCTIKVLRAIRGRLMLNPRVIEIKSHGRWITATLFIPPVPGEQVNTDETLRLYPTGIEAKYQRFSKYGMSRCAPTFAFAYFDKQQVIDALGPGQFDVSVVGKFLSGRFFFGSDTIRIISPKPKPPPYHWHW